MPRRKLPGEEAKKPQSFSIEKSKYKRFIFICGQHNSSASRELRNFVLETIKKYDEEKNKKKHE